ncbi:MAG: FkbM family methyltransferase, partial [Christensenella sp.]
ALKKSTLPLVVYGCGDLASHVSKILISHDISISAIAVDRLDNTPKYEILKPYPIITCDDLKADTRFSKYNIILGFGRAYKNILSGFGDKFKNADNIFYLTGIYDGAVDAFSIDSFSTEDLKESFDELSELYDNLSDDMSKDSLTAYLLSRISADAKFNIPFVCTPQYFCKDFLTFSDREVLIDGGAYTGDSIKDFLKVTGGKYAGIFAFEPDTHNVECLKSFVEQNHLHDVKIINKGLLDHDGSISFLLTSNMTSQICDDVQATATIPITTIDSVIGDAGNKMSPPTFIKMDIEGSEIAALHGAQNTITQYKPTLAISMYHKKNDIINIAKYARSLVPEYKLYFRMHKYLPIDAVLYATVK